MSVAVDQTRLRRIAEAILAGKNLSRAEAVTILSIAQLAAGIEPGTDPAEHAALQAVAQQVGARVGLKPGELLSIPWLPNEETRRAPIEALAAQLETRGARELAYALAFVISVSDMELTPAETAALEVIQRMLGVDDRKATDLIVLVAETVAGGPTGHRDHEVSGRR